LGQAPTRPSGVSMRSIKELEKTTKDEGRIKTIWDRINGVASTVAAALSAAASIGKIVLGGGA